MIPRALFLLSCVSPFPVCLCPRFSGRRSACACLAPLSCLPVVPLSSRASLSLVPRCLSSLVPPCLSSLLPPCLSSLVCLVSPLPYYALTFFIFAVWPLSCRDPAPQGPDPPRRTSWFSTTRVPLQFHLYRCLHIDLPECAGCPLVGVFLHIG